ncbi:MAG: sulfur oxidation c-type cytochrome SoxA [Rhodobacteraceae bacterium]|nr:sulfur oxidation c-type cytochrome SoxA [Paracoccaceae bacterium]
MRSAPPIFLALGFLAAASSPIAEEPDLFGGEFPLSGYLYMGDQVRALQDDEFQNPGLFAVEFGEELWSTPTGGKGLSCQSCHEEASDSMRSVAATYPQFDEELGSLVNLEARINEMLTAYMDAPAFPQESDELLSLTAFVTFQSRGIPIGVDISGEAERYWQEGHEFYTQRRGQLNLACNQCHDDLAGFNLRGDRISQGHVNGFPVYRLMWNSMGSRHRMFRWCNWAVRAEPYELGSREYLSLELYLAWRSNGLPIEAPAVRP